jgi:hypothetical protein
VRSAATILCALLDPAEFAQSLHQSRSQQSIGGGSRSNVSASSRFRTELWWRVAAHVGPHPAGINKLTTTQVMPRGARSIARLPPCSLRPLSCDRRSGRQKSPEVLSAIDPMGDVSLRFASCHVVNKRLWDPHGTHGIGVEHLRPGLIIDVSDGLTLRSYDAGVIEKEVNGLPIQFRGSGLDACGISDM